MSCLYTNINILYISKTSFIHHMSGVILIPFNIPFVFTIYKHLLDAFQGSCKDKLLEQEFP